MSLPHTIQTLSGLVGQDPELPKVKGLRSWALLKPAADPGLHWPYAAPGKV